MSEVTGRNVHDGAHGIIISEDQACLSWLLSTSFKES